MQWSYLIEQMEYTFHERVCVAKTQTNVSNENILPYFFRFIQFTAITFWLMVPDAIQPV